MPTCTSQSSDNPIPITTPARMPKTSAPRMAAIATQKSTDDTLRRRRISGTSIMPITTASMMRAARTGLGKEEKRGASTSNASSTVTPDVREASPLRAPDRSLRELADRLVDTGMPLARPAPMFAAA